MKKYSTLLVTALAGPSGPQYGPEQTLTLQPDGTDGIDTYIQSNETANHGTDTGLWIGKWPSLALVDRYLVKFTGISAIPAGSQINSAVLSLFIAGDQSSLTTTINAHRLKRNWVETEATKNIYSTGNNWQTAMADGANDRETAVMGTCSIGDAPAQGYEMTISLDTTLFKEWTDGTTPNYGVIIKTSDETTDGDYNFRSSDATQAAQRPKLVVKYQVPL